MCPSLKNFVGGKSVRCIFVKWYIGKFHFFLFRYSGYPGQAGQGNYGQWGYPGYPPSSS